MSGYDLVAALDAIDPKTCDYASWLAVGQALHYEGFGSDVWRDWSRRDITRFNERDFDVKWRGFGENASDPVTGGTIVKMALDNGWHPVWKDEDGKAHRALGWDSVIGGAKEAVEPDEPAIVDAASVGDFDEEVKPLYSDGHGRDELRAYLDALFEPGEYVGYVCDYEETEKDGTTKLIPGSRGVYSRTMGEIRDKLSKGIESAIGTVHPEAGAWIRFNPLDGQGVGNANVTAYRYALLESDDMPQGKFAAIVKQLNLPVAAMVDSGNKSLHAIVRIDASDAKQYRERVEALYSRCEKNGIAVDKANKNPSRLSRMPGVMRNGKRQYLAGLSQGAADWEEWDEWYAAETDELPDAVPLDQMLGDNLPPLKPALIDGLLRVGHKMLMSGPSKAGKSFALIALCIAFAEGREWFGFACRKSRVMYVNLELDGDSCINRFNDMYNALGLEPKNASEIDVWNLRGKSEPLARLLPKLVRRARKRGTEVVVIDPLYKVMVGDENSAGDMAAFANLFDALCDQAGVSVIYCHHHSKGSQADKRAIDRASGSGVFGRDPDAIIDMIELDVEDGLRWQRINEAVCRECARTVAEAGGADVWNSLPETTRKIERNALGTAQDLLDGVAAAELGARCADIKARRDSMSAWRIEGTLREFPRFAPVSAWFDWPLHVVDPKLDECKEIGSLDSRTSRSAGEARSRKQSKEDKRHAEINAELKRIVEESEEPPTKAEALEMMDEIDGKAVTQGQLEGWLRKDWCRYELKTIEVGKPGVIAAKETE